MDYSGGTRVVNAIVLPFIPCSDVALTGDSSLLVNLAIYVFVVPHISFCLSG